MKMDLDKVLGEVLGDDDFKGKILVMEKWKFNVYIFAIILICVTLGFLACYFTVKQSYDVDFLGF